jgi:hypothetical protein
MGAVDMQPPESPVFTGQPWRFFGWSRGRWERLARQKLTPEPVDLPGDRLWRISDLLTWAASLPTRSASAQPEVADVRA